jgi:hypothetical protein
LKQFIGRRQSQKIAIESYYFDKPEMSSQQQQQQQLVENAMTMQKALETAYSDWNRDKKNSESNAESSESGN